MNIETKIDERLWRAIQSTYNDRNFTGAILDAIYLLSDLIREKTGLESDGAALAGQAFGGKSPKLKVSKLQTESEKNIQVGIEQLLRGLYQAIRNPRSHEKHTDKQDDADAIILFINYLVQIIDQSKTPFTKSEFLKRVFDTQFVKNERYAKLLASEVPPKHRIGVMLDIFRDRETGDGNKLKYFVEAMLPKLTKGEKAELYAAISDELKFTDSDSAIRSILQIFPSDCLSKLDEAARLRTENKLLQSIKEGQYLKKGDKCVAGALGTWARNRCSYFILKNEMIHTLTTKLRSDNSLEHEYVFKYFWEALVSLTTSAPPRLVNTIKKKLKEGNKNFYERLMSEKKFGSPEWVEPFKQEIDSFKESEQTPDTFSTDDIPF